MDSLNGAPILVKVVSGGGERGLRAVERPEDLDEAFIRCTSEAKAAFGNPALYVEEYLPNARHLEVQLLGGGADLVHLWERECSIQRRRRSMEDLIKNTTGDGMVCGLAQINGQLFGPERARAMVMSYDYMLRSHHRHRGRQHRHRRAGHDRRRRPGRVQAGGSGAHVRAAGQRRG